MQLILYLLLSGTVPVFAADSALLFNKTFGGSGNDYVTAIATDPSGFVIVGGNTSSYDFPVTNGSRNSATQFARTSDSGGSWQPMGNLPQGTPAAMAVDPSATQVWYAAGSAGVFRSTDGGATWSLSLAGGATSVVIDRDHPSTLYAIVNWAVVKTIDAGATWKTIGPPVFSSYLAMDPFHPDHIFTGSAAVSFRSFDGGLSWAPFSTSAPNPANHCSSGLTPLAFDPGTAGLVYMADHYDVFRSTDGGLSWTFVPRTFDVAFGVAVAPKSSVVYVSSNGGFYASADRGDTWTLILPAPFSNTPRFVAFDPAQPSVIIAGNMRSDDGGTTFTPLSLGRDTNAIVFDPTHSGRAIAATEGASTAFLAKLDSAGTILAATYLGGQGGSTISGVRSGVDGRIYVTGDTSSRDFPVTPGAWFAGPPGSGKNYFAAAFDADLNLVYSTYLRSGIAQIAGIAVDSSGSAVVAGSGSDSLGTNWKCFAMKLKPDGSGTLFDTRFGSSSNDYCAAVAEDAAGNTVVAGNTFGADFPLAGNGTQTRRQGERDAIIAKLDPDGNLVYSGYLGGSIGDWASAVAVDAAGNIYVAGNTSSKDFPTTKDAYQTSLSSKCPYPSSSFATGLIGTISSYFTDDVFITKLDPTGNLTYSTYLGGGCYDVPTSIAVDDQNNVWITGATNSDPFPQAMPFESGPRNTYYKAFVSKLDAGGGSVSLSSYLTAGIKPWIAADTFGNAYVGGSTTKPQSPYGGPPAPPPVITGVDAVLAKVQPQFPGAIRIDSVGNAFTLRSGPVSPGQITLIAADGLNPKEAVDLTFTPAGPLPRSLAETQVLFDGEAAALVSVAAGRVVAIAPYDLADKQQVSVQVIFQGTLSAPMIAEVAADPGYLSLDGSGAGQAYARNPDGSLNSSDNPAPRASSVTVYVTGAGKVDPACPEGGVSPSDAPAVGQFQPVAGSVCGLFQTTFAVPAFGTGNTVIPLTSLTIAMK